MDILQDLLQGIPEGRPQRPQYYHRDGTPIIDNELMPATLQWGLLFENENRHVGHTKTLYGERLSTVWLGMDHSFFSGPPLLFETMLFVPDDWKPLRWKTGDAERFISRMKGEEGLETEEDKQRDEENERRAAHCKKYFPHDGLQLRYTTEYEATDSHELLKMQCLIPPRWRHFLLWTIGRQSAWSHYDDDEEEIW